MIVRFRICNRVRVDAFKKSFAAMSLVAISITICVVYHTPIAQSASRDTLAAYDPSLAKAVSAFEPVIATFIPRSSAEKTAASDFVETIAAPDGGEDIRILVKAPAPADPSKILHVAPKSPELTANAYFARAISQAISGGYAEVVFPTGVYDFVAPPTQAQSHVSIENAKDLVIDGQGSKLNFASPLSAGITISNSARIVIRGFTIDWPNTLMASLGTIVSIDKRGTPRTMRVQTAPQYKVDATTQIVALSPWDAKTDPANPHFALRNFNKEQYTFNRGTVYLGNRTFEVPYRNDYIVVGDEVLIRHFGGSPYKNAVQTGGSHDLDFENITIYASPYLGFLLSAGGGYRLSHCSVTRRDAARLISTAADAVHVSDNTGDLIVEDGTFGYQGDDGLNIHGVVSGTARAGQPFEHWSVGGEGSQKAGKSTVFGSNSIRSAA